MSLAEVDVREGVDASHRVGVRSVPSYEYRPEVDLSSAVLSSFTLVLSCSCASHVDGFQVKSYDELERE